MCFNQRSLNTQNAHVAICSSLHLVFVFGLICLSTSQQAQFNISKLSLNETCGRITEIAGDARTLVPWNAAIFIAQRSNRQPKFVNAGVLISPTTVLTVFGGFYGARLGKNKRYAIPHPRNFIIAVGLSSIDFISADRFTQISRVNYILPYRGHEEENKHFHFWLYHLKTPINLDTPFARTPCIPHFLQGRPSSWQLMHGGYTELQSSTELSRVKVDEAVALSETDCDEIVRTHYGGNSSTHVWCSTLGVPRKLAPQNQNVCLLHGSAVVVRRLQRWFLAGITAMIPDKKHGRCNHNTKYIHARMQNHNSWLLHNVQCGSKQFSCADATCIPLNQVCNRIANCPGPGTDTSDEDPIFCEAQNRCRKGRRQVECHLRGKCLHASQLCDEIKDCDGGSDEHKEFCQQSLRSSASQNLDNHKTNSNGKCFPIPVSEGTKLICLHPSTNRTVSCTENILEDTVVILTCAKYYSAKFRVPKITMKCMANGLWSDYRRFACEPNCGVLTSDVTALIINAQNTNRKNTFPWYAAIFREQQDGKYNFICGGTLIESNVVLTAAHCVEEFAKVPRLRSKYKVILAPVSSNYEDNLTDKLAVVVDVKQAKVPPSYNFVSLSSDIAIVELSKSVIFGMHIRPACYLQHYSSVNFTLGQYGKVAGFGYDENGQISENLKFANFPIVSRINCSIPSYSNVPASTFCAGYNNGTSLCYGDSGGGIVFLDSGRDYERYTVKGIVSAEANIGIRKRLCQAGSYSIFTHVDAFREWILETLEKIDA